MFAIIPLTILPLIIFNVLTFAHISFFGADPMAYQVATIGMMSGQPWALPLSDVLIAFAILCLFFEILRSTGTTSKSIFNHVLSTIVLIVYVVEFVLVREAASSVFFLLTLISLFDVLAGFSITIKTAVRDVAINRVEHA